MNDSARLPVLSNGSDTDTITWTGEFLLVTDTGGENQGEEEKAAFMFEFGRISEQCSQQGNKLKVATGAPVWDARI